MRDHAESCRTMTIKVISDIFWFVSSINWFILSDIPYQIRNDCIVQSKGYPCQTFSLGSLYFQLNVVSVQTLILVSFLIINYLSNNCFYIKEYEGGS